MPIDAASSLSVFNAFGAAAINASTSDFTNAVVASCVVLVPRLAVGAAGSPVNVGESNVARSASAEST